MCMDAKVTSFGLASIKQEGTTQDLETGEIWVTTAEQKYLEGLRDQIKRSQRKTAWLTGIVVAITTVNVAIFLWAVV